MTKHFPTMIAALGLLLLAGILAGCRLANPAVSQIQVSLGPTGTATPSISHTSTLPGSTRTPLPTKPPVYLVTKMPSAPTQVSSDPYIPTPPTLPTPTTAPQLTPTILMVQRVPNDQLPLLPKGLSLDMYHLKRPISDAAAEDYNFTQVQADIQGQSRWGEPGFAGIWEAGLQAANTQLAPFGYRMEGKYSPPEGARVILYQGDKKVLEDIEEFSPVSVNRSMTDFLLLIKQTSRDPQLVRHQSIQPWIWKNSQAIPYWNTTAPQFLGENILYADIEVSATSQNVRVNVYCNDQSIYTTILNSPPPTSMHLNLWTYGSRWALELMDTVIIDGKPVNVQYGYQKSYAFHLLDGKPLFLFDKDGKVNINFDGQVVTIDGKIVPHNHCCSPALLNPRQKGNLLVFFLNKNETWYYVEVGVPSLASPQ